ncbi:ATP-binding protein [Cryptosporangium sp. NPDC051539]|uniref:ATP-binding protein n=1 Tax=Cryptosporangium sp. NPDC051539 TaxID=3363962 RepID=UPI00378B7F87
MSTSGEQVRLQILGPLRVWRGGVEVGVGPRQQALLLAVLLARAGTPISTSELIDLIWPDEVPTSASNTLQKYAGALRRLLEPTLPVRSAGSFLRRTGNGYLFAAVPGSLDVVTFRNLVASAEASRAAERPGAALDAYVDALTLWHGAVGEGLAHGSAAAIFGALESEFVDACVAAGRLAVARAQPGRVVAALRLAARLSPLHETVQASLISALATARRHAEAAASFRAVRARLAEELGVDPGPALMASYRLIGRPSQAVPGPASTAAGTLRRTGLIGRGGESGVIRRAVDAAFAGDSGLVVVTGEPGAGKTHLLHEAGAEAGGRGALVVGGRCLDGGGAPSMWPWVQIVGALVDVLPAGTHHGDLGRLTGSPGDVDALSVLPDSGATFRLFERVVALIGQVAVDRPVVLVVDDLHWADATSLEMFRHLAARMPAGTTVIGALRDRPTEPGSALARMLAAASRSSRHRRIRLGPFDPAEVAELVRREIGRDPGPDVAQRLHARTGGNPFFVRELSRLLARSGEVTEAAAAGAGVPATVRDVVHDRVIRLSDDARGLLETVALIGREADLALLARSTGLDAETCAARLEPLIGAGLLEPAADDPHAFVFAHDLVRESVADSTPLWRATTLHLRIADALERTTADDDAVAERLAHHLRAAGPLADPARTAAALIRAGRCAAGKSALDAAGLQLQRAVELAGAAALPVLELSALSLLTAVDGMRVGYVGSALGRLERAEHLARQLGREQEAAEFLFSRWAACAQGIQLDRSAPLAGRLLREGEAGTDPLVRAYGNYAWGIHQWSIGNVGEAYRYLTDTDTAALETARGREDTLRRDLRMIAVAMRAMTTALHGEVDAAWAQLDTMETDAGEDPYAVTVWAAYAARVAALVGDPARARRAADRGIAVDTEFSFGFLGTYQRLARCWAKAVTGDDAVGAVAEARELIAAGLVDPPRSDLATWLGLMGEMCLAAGLPEQAAAALDRADTVLARHGQRYAEGLLLQVRARLLQSSGRSVPAVRAAAQRARSVSARQGAHLFARRSAALLAELGPVDEPQSERLPH